VESLKSEGERELRDTKEKHRQEIQELTLENQALQSRADDRRDRDLIRQLRREVDENKRRATELLSENSELRKERDTLKLDKGEATLKHTRDMEDIKNAHRQMLSECERLSFKCQVAEDDR
jgi:regulator of replication initiation timing